MSTNFLTIASIPIVGTGRGLHIAGKEDNRAIGLDANGANGEPGGQRGLDGTLQVAGGEPLAAISLGHTHRVRSSWSGSPLLRCSGFRPLCAAEQAAVIRGVW